MGMLAGVDLAGLDLVCHFTRRAFRYRTDRGRMGAQNASVHVGLFLFGGASGRVFGGDDGVHGGVRSEVIILWE